MERPDLSYVGRDEVADELFHVVVDGASFLDGGDDRREVVVGEHHLRGGLGDRRARAHRDADLGLLQRRRVVDTVARLATTTYSRNLYSTNTRWRKTTFLSPYSLPPGNFVKYADRC